MSVGFNHQFIPAKITFTQQIKLKTLTESALNRLHFFIVNNQVLLQASDKEYDISKHKSDS